MTSSPQAGLELRIHWPEAPACRQSSIHSPFERYLRSAIDGARHVLRHSCGYKLANDGRDTRAIAALMIFSSTLVVLEFLPQLLEFIPLDIGTHDPAHVPPIDCGKVVMLLDFGHLLKQAHYLPLCSQLREPLINLRIVAHCAFDSRATVWTGN